MGANDQLGEAAGDARGYRVHAEAALIRDQRLMKRLFQALGAPHHPAARIEPNRTTLYACGSSAASQAASIRPEGGLQREIAGFDQ
jgi:hypothetical protein